MAVFEKLAEKDVVRKDRQMDEYKANGYFIRDDGTKSNEGNDLKTSKKNSGDVESQSSVENEKPAQKKMSKPRIAKIKKEKAAIAEEIEESSAKNHKGNFEFSDSD